MRWCLVLLVVLSGSLSAESRVTDGKTAQAQVAFRIVIPARHYSKQIFDQNAPLDRGQERNIERLPNGGQRITLVWP